jgi:hypothetical protein
MDQVPPIPSGSFDGAEVHLNDPRIPQVLLNLRPELIRVYSDHVWVHLGGPSGEGFNIYREPHLHPVGKAETVKINDRLWYL